MKIIGMLFLIVLLWGGEAEAFVNEYGNCTLFIDGVASPCVGSHEPSGLSFPVGVPYACDDMDIIFNGSTTLATCKNGRWSKLVEPCLATMEAAMRAMDEFVPKRHTISFITDTTLLLFMPCDDACEERRIIESAEGRLAEVKREQAAITQWEQAKKNCWGKP